MVSGFTDDRQVRDGNRRFADNWELSAQRALTVTRALIEEGMPSSSVFAAAFGAEQPVASNADADGRSQNRRVRDGAHAEAVPRAGRAEWIARSAARARRRNRGTRTVTRPPRCGPGGQQGAHRLDPVRFHFLEALARRVAVCEGASRAVLDERLVRLLAEHGEALANARAAEEGARRCEGGGRDAGPSHAAAPVAERVARPSARPAPQRREAAPRRGPLAGLVEQLARPAAPSAGEGPARASLALGPDHAPDLQSLGYFRDTWSRLSAERRVTQSLHDVPVNAGPLNSRRLVHRALVSMRELSPDYLHRFVAYIDALLWLEGVNGRGGTPPGK